ncbi:MAG: four helix bundle protein [Candidatus Edwardsbacteria bacterium]
MEKEAKFGFEELEVWQKAIEFANIVIDALENLNTDRKHFRLIEQAESAVTSIAMNIAEGKGRFSKRE